MLVGLGVVLVGEGGDVLAVAVEGDASGEDLCLTRRMLFWTVGEGGSFHEDLI